MPRIKIFSATISWLTTNLVYAEGTWKNVAGCNNPTPIGIRKLLMNVYNSFSDIAALIGSISYLGGLSFIVSGVLKLKQYRDNPTQVSIGTPLTFIVVGVAMIFLPNVINVTRETIFTQSDFLGGVTSEMIVSNPFAVEQGCG